MYDDATAIGALSRRRLLALGGLVAASALTAYGTHPSAASPGSPGPAAPPQITPQEAKARLEAGNARFATGQAMHPNQGVQARDAVAEHQHPWALVHGCIDSRVAPELVFDLGVGDVFTSRTAAAVLDDTIVGSMEFAVMAPYEIPLIVILGHTGCGAVAATVNALQSAPASPTAPGEVLDIVNEIAPVARQVPPNPDKAEFVDDVVRADAIAVAAGLVQRSSIIRDAVEAGRTQVIAAVYDLTTGRVSWL